MARRTVKREATVKVRVVVGVCKGGGWSGGVAHDLRAVFTLLEPSSVRRAIGGVSRLSMDPN